LPWNVHLPPAEWYCPTPPAITAQYDFQGPWKFDLEPIVREALDQDVISIDTETTGLNIVKDMPLFWSMAWGERRMCMPASTLPMFRQVFNDPNKRWVFANAKYDMHIIKNYGLELKGECADTAVMHALLYEEAPHGLKDMARQILGWKWTDFKDTFGLSEKKDGAVAEALFRAEQQNLPLLVEYASNDAYGTLKIYEKLKKELESTSTYSLYPAEFATMADIFFKTEMPYTKVLWGMERKGVRINVEYLAQILGPCQKTIADLEKEIARMAGRMINPNSPDQMVKLFVEEMKLKPLKYTKGGKKGIKKPSVDWDFLDHYKNEHPLCKAMLEHRDLKKLEGTYILGLQKRMDPYGRVHTKYNQDVARTGRLSSSDPNLQNIPKPESDRFQLRGAFSPREGYDLIVVDYSALEMRLLAAAAMDPLMTQIFLDGKDIHMGNAEMVFGRKCDPPMLYDEIKAAKKTDGQVKEGKLGKEAMTERVKMALHFRNAIKTISFGMNYGMKENKLARDLNISKQEALDLMDEYMNTYPAVKEFYAEAIAETEMTGFSYTIIGRRRFHPEIASPRDMERWSAQRAAVNNQIQGGAADVVRFAQLNIDAAGLEEHFGCEMLMQVHDELVFEVPKENTERVKPYIKHLMEHPFFTDLAVPLEVSMSHGPSWMHAK
jgi:DNA polymerase-1